MTKRVAVYARVSTTRQAENDISIPDQLAQAKRYCKAKGWHVIREFVGAGASALGLGATASSGAGAGALIDAGAGSSGGT